MAQHAYDDFLRERRTRFSSFLVENGITAAVFRDAEGARDSAIRYFTGHPGDAVLVIASSGFTVLSPWDEHMASLMADANLVVPFTAFERDHIRAAHEIIKNCIEKTGGKIEIPPATSYPDFLKYVDAIQEFTVVCRGTDGAHKAVTEMRAVKDDYEIQCLKKACGITNEIIELIIEGVSLGRIQTEIDAMLLIEKESRQRGGEGAAFDTLAAGPSRSFGIHCFPPSTSARFPDDGLSILDFGVCCEGYSSDVTLTITRGTLSAAQEKQVELVQKAYDEAFALYKPGIPVHDSANKVKAVFARAKREMPHGLGHGVGLDVHEFPTVRESTPKDVVFLPGMTATLEPGLYHAQHGGCRLENTILITQDGGESLTASRIARL